MYPISQASFAAHKVTMVERKVIDRWAATVPAAKQKYVRWMRLDWGVIVFVANPDYMDPPRDPAQVYVRNPRGGRQVGVPLAPGGGYQPWIAFNSNTIVDQVSCDVHAYMP
jgi:hypothetical protein